MKTIGEKKKKRKDRKKINFGSWEVGRTVTVWLFKSSVRILTL